MSFIRHRILNDLFSFSIHRQNYVCRLTYWSLTTESLPREGKIIPNLLSQEANSSADPREHGDEYGRQTVPRLHLHSPPSDNPGSGPDPQHISCQQSLNVLEAGKEQRVS